MLLVKFVNKTNFFITYFLKLILADNKNALIAFKKSFKRLLLNNQVEYQWIINSFPKQG